MPALFFSVIGSCTCHRDTQTHHVKKTCLQLINAQNEIHYYSHSIITVTRLWTTRVMQSISPIYMPAKSFMHSCHKLLGIFWPWSGGVHNEVEALAMFRLLATKKYFSRSKKKKKHIWISSTIITRGGQQKNGERTSFQCFTHFTCGKGFSFWTRITSFMKQAQ